MLKTPIAITLGDAAGIGPEIIAKSFRQQPALLQGCFVWGDVGSMRRATAQLSGTGASLPLAHIRTPQEVWQVPPHCIPVLQEGDALGPVAPGQVSAAAGAFAGRCVMAAARAARRSHWPLCRPPWQQQGPSANAVRGRRRAGASG